MIKKFAPLVIFILFGWYLVGANFGAKLGMIDDHEIAYLIGPDGRIPISQFVPTLMKTEVGQWGTYLRFRPSYYTLRVLESALWHTNASVWYGFRFVLLILSLILGYLILRLFLPTIVSFASVFYFMTLPFWSDIWTRLGPSEIYAVPAVLTFLYGLFWDRPWVWLIGYVIAVGSKENLLVLMPILIVWEFYRYGQKKLNKKELIFVGAAIIYTAWIVAAIVLATSRAGTDVYGTQISYSARLLTLWQHKRYIVESQHLQLSLFAGIGMLYLILRGGVRRILHNPHLPYFLVMVVLAITLASQQIFYSNGLPTNMRYDFPGMLTIRLFDLTVVAWILSRLPGSAKGTLLRALLTLGVTAVLLIQIFRHGYGPLRTQAAVNAAKSSEFDSHLTQLIVRAQQNPDFPIVMISDYYLDFEPITSVARFIRSRGVTNPLMLHYTQSPTPQDPLEKELSPRLTAVQEKGASEDIFSAFTPFTDPQSQCLSVSFGKELPSPCEHVTIF